MLGRKINTGKRLEIIKSGQFSESDEEHVRYNYIYCKEQKTSFTSSLVCRSLFVSHNRKFKR